MGTEHTLCRVLCVYLELHLSFECRREKKKLLKRFCLFHKGQNHTYNLEVN